MSNEEDKMIIDEDKTLEDILEAIPVEEKPEEDETEAIPDFIKQEKSKKEEKEDDKLKTQPINFQTNKEVLNTGNNLSFGNFMTAFETKQKEKKILILGLFLTSVIDMLNIIIDTYTSKEDIILEKLSYLNIEVLLEKMPLYLIKLQRLMDIIILCCPENEKKIYSTIDEERKMLVKVENKNIKPTAFETLVNLKFKKLYKYFIKDCKIITKGWRIYYLEEAFKTLSDVIKGNEGLIEKEEIDSLISLEKLDNMEIDTLDLENSRFEII